MPMGARRKFSVFILFYRQIFSFSIMIAIAFLVMTMAFKFAMGSEVADEQSLLLEMASFFGKSAIEFSTYYFAGALGLTHYVQKNQYYYYRNQGCSIRFLIIASWAANCFVSVFLLIVSILAGLYG